MLIKDTTAVLRKIGHEQRATVRDDGLPICLYHYLGLIEMNDIRESDKHLMILMMKFGIRLRSHFRLDPIMAIGGEWRDIKVLTWKDFSEELYEDLAEYNEILDEEEFKSPEAPKHENAAMISSKSDLLCGL